MKIDALGLQGFLAIADKTSFRKASDALGITQTALTRRLQKIEDTLGVKLVERTTRTVALTKVGLDFLPRARNLLGELEAALTEIRQSGRALRGDVSIACIPTAGVVLLPRIIRRYSEKYPENSVRILDHLSQGVTDAVLRREAELGINMLVPRHPELNWTPLLEDRYVVICRSDHPLARKRSVTWRQLEGHRLIVPGRGSGNHLQLEAVLTSGQFSLDIKYEIHRSTTAIGLVAQGLGAAIVPGLGIHQAAYPGLKILMATDPVISRQVVLLSRKLSYLSPAAQALKDMIERQALSD